MENLKTEQGLANIMMTESSPQMPGETNGKRSLLRNTSIEMNSHIKLGRARSNRPELSNNLNI